MLIWWLWYGRSCDHLLALSLQLEGCCCSGVRSAPFITWLIVRVASSGLEGVTSLRAPAVVGLSTLVAPCVVLHRFPHVPSPHHTDRHPFGSSLLLCPHISLRALPPSQHQNCNKLRVRSCFSWRGLLIYCGRASSSALALALSVAAVGSV